MTYRIIYFALTFFAIVSCSNKEPLENRMVTAQCEEDRTSIVIKNGLATVSTGSRVRLKEVPVKAADNNIEINHAGEDKTVNLTVPDMHGKGKVVASVIKNDATDEGTLTLLECDIDNGTRKAM